MEVYESQTLLASPADLLWKTPGCVHFASVVFDFTVWSCRLSLLARLQKIYVASCGTVAKDVFIHDVVPGFVAVGAPCLILGGFPPPERGPVAWIGLRSVAVGASIYFSCAWEFAVRGLGTPAPIAPTKFLVVGGLHRYVRNPMYLDVALVILGEAVLFRAPQLIGYAAGMLLIAHTFVIFYEEPTLRRQFGESYEQYRRTVPRWIPRFRKSEHRT